MPSGRDILWVVGFPAVLTALAMLATRPWRGRRRAAGDDAVRRRGAGWPSAIAIAGGFAVAFAGLFLTPNGVFTPPRFPPAAGEQWVLLLTIPIVLVAIVQTFIRARWFGMAASVALLLVTPYLVRRTQQPYVEPRQFWTWVIGAGVVMTAWWLVMEELARRVVGGSLPLIVGIWTGVSALTIIDAGIQSLGMATGSVAVAAFVIALAAWWSRGAPLPRGGMLALGVIVPGMLLCGYFFAELKPRDLGLLAVAPLAAWAGQLPGLGESDSRKRTLVRVIAVLAVLGFTAVMSIRGLKRTADDQMKSYVY